MVTVPFSPWEEQYLPVLPLPKELTPFLRIGANRKTVHSENVLLPESSVKIQQQYHDSQIWLSIFHPSSPIFPPQPLMKHQRLRLDLSRRQEPKKLTKYRLKFLQGREYIWGPVISGWCHLFHDGRN